MTWTLSIVLRWLVISLFCGLIDLHEIEEIEQYDTTRRARSEMQTLQILCWSYKLIGSKTAASIRIGFYAISITRTDAEKVKCAQLEYFTLN